MLFAIAETLPLSLGVALSPVPVAATLLLLPTGAQRNRAPALLLGWVLGIVIVGLITVLAPGLETSSGEPTVISCWLQLGLGIALLSLAMRHWLRRSKDYDRKEPAFFRKLESLDFWHTVVAGTVLMAANPMNLALIVAASNLLDTRQLAPVAQAIALAFFVMGASSFIAVPILAYHLSPERMIKVLVSGRNWLVRNNDAILGALLFMFGAALIANGTKALVAT
jgi:hypothetical protein